MSVTEPPEIIGLLSDPLRWQLVVELGRSDRRVGELVEIVGKPQNLVSYHLRQLRRAGIAGSRRSSADGRDVYYSADLLRCRDLLGDAGRTLLGHGVPASTSSAARPARRRPRVLFLCTGNSARSQMAEALVERRSNGTVIARSAGSHPKPLHPNAVLVMAERGIDIAGRPTKPLSRFTRSRFDRVITLCDKVREICPEFPGTPDVVHWSIGDPADDAASDAASKELFDAVADELDRRVGLLVTDLRRTQIPASTTERHET